MTFAELQNANKSIKTTNIKGKDYAEVNQRIKVFRMLYPEGFIRTELISLQDGMVIFKAEVGVKETNSLTATGEYEQVMATGHAYEKESSSQINRTSFIENCETSAVGRALGMLGIGIDTSIASAEEVANAIYQQESKKEAPICGKCGRPIQDGRKRNGEIWTKENIAAYTAQEFGKPLCSVCASEERKNAGKTN